VLGCVYDVAAHTCFSVFPFNFYSSQGSKNTERASKRESQNRNLKGNKK
jgi:hypothetical protein